MEHCRIETGSNEETVYIDIQAECNLVINVNGEKLFCISKKELSSAHKTRKLEIPKTTIERNVKLLNSKKCRVKKKVKMSRKIQASKQNEAGILSMMNRELNKGAEISSKDLGANKGLNVDGLPNLKGKH